jgi:hypothetical protein
MRSVESKESTLFRFRSGIPSSSIFRYNLDVFDDLDVWDKPVVFDSLEFDPVQDLNDDLILLIIAVSKRTFGAVGIPRTMNPHVISARAQSTTGDTA